MSDDSAVVSSESGGEPEIPNATTRRALADAQRRRNLVRFASVDELLDDLGISQRLGRLRPH